MNTLLLKKSLRIVETLIVGAILWACTSSNDDGGFAGGSSDDAGVYAVKDLDVAGVSQKGPFVKGSAVTVQGIDCQTMELTHEIFEGTVKSDKGDYDVGGITLSSSCAVFEVTGLYLDEFTGAQTTEPVTLRSLVNLKDRKSVNVNVLTRLEYDRVVKLVSEQNASFADAKKQAENEVLGSFGIAKISDNFEDLNFFKKGDGNAALLAVSVLALASGESGKNVNVEERLNEFSTAISNNGSLDDSTKTEIANWAASAMANGKIDTIRKNIESWGYADEVPEFEKFVIERDSLVDTRDGQVYKTVKIGNQVWMAENLNYADSVKSPILEGNSWCYNDSSKYCDKYGRLYAWSAALNVCPEGWHLPDTTEWNTLFESVDNPYFVGRILKSKSDWQLGRSGPEGIDALGFNVLPAGTGHTGDFVGWRVYGHFWSSVLESDGAIYAIRFGYDEDQPSITLENESDGGMSVRCIKGVVSDSSSGSETEAKYCKTETQDNCEYGTLTDSRDGQTYKTVKIGNQTWMAENLNYADSVETPSLMDKSWCYNDSSEYCDKYGRLYTWAAAMDSVRTGCGDGMICSHAEPVQGICPDGYHLPSVEEFGVLIEAVGPQKEAGKIFKSTSGWASPKLSNRDAVDESGDGTDAVGFTALPAGYRDYNGGFGDDGYETTFWSSTDGSEEVANFLRLDYYDREAVWATNYVVEKRLAYSVRCLKD